MITKTVEAKREGKVVGTKDVEFPETLDECVVSMGSEEGVVDCVCGKIMLNTQASIRRPQGGGKVAKATYDKCIAAGIEDSVARTVSSYTGEEDETPTQV